MIRVITLSALLALLPLEPSQPRLPQPAVAWPRLVMFYGGELGDERRVIARHEDVIRFMGALRAPTHSTHLGGPYVEVGLYWYSPLWEPYAADTTRFAELPLPRIPWSGLPAPAVTEPARHVQPARLYLGTSASPPVFDWFSAGANPGVRSVDAAGIELLDRLDLPMRR